MIKNLKGKISAIIMVFLLISLQVFAFTGCSLPAASTGKETTGTSSRNVSETTGQNTDGSAKLTESTTGTVSQESNTANNQQQAVQTGTKTGRIPVVLYYQDADRFLVPVTRWIEKQQGIAKAALAGLTDSAINREELQYYGLYPVIPVNTDVLGINIKEGIATVDFDKNLLNFKDKASEKTMLTSVVYTLTSFKTISGVRFLVNGYEQKELNNGTNISGIFYRDEMMINTGETLDGIDVHKTDVYMLKKANENYTYFVPVSVAYKGENTEPDPLKLFELLTKKTGNESLYNEIPEGTEISNASVKGGILTVDFNSKLAGYGGGNTREDAVVRQILYTSGQLKGVTKVRLLIDGKKAELPEGTDLSSPVSIPSSINGVIDNM